MTDTAAPSEVPEDHSSAGSPSDPSTAADPSSASDPSSANGPSSANDASSVPPVPAHLEYPAVGAQAVLNGSARRWPDRVAVRDGEQELTYAQLHDHALRFAAGLRERGVRPGDPVMLLLPNSLWFPVAYWGILFAGAVVSPSNPALPPAAIGDQLEDAGARAAVVHPQSLTSTLAAHGSAELAAVVLVPATTAAPAPVGDGEAAAEAAGAANLVAAADLLGTAPLPAPHLSAPDDLAHLAFTGGTTGRPKAVRVLHRNVVANAVQTTTCRAAARITAGPGGEALEIEHDPVTSAASAPYHSRLGQETGITIAPMFHAMGLIGMVAGALGGGTSQLFGRFDPVRYLDEIERLKVRHLGGSPALHRAVLAVAAAGPKRDLSHVTMVGSGAAPLDVETKRRLAELFPNALIAEGYGLTEATMALTLVPVRGDLDIPSGTVGLALPDTELSIRDLADPDKELPPGEIGELWARGPQITDGYHGHPDRTAEQFPDGWLRTGDLATVDEQGYLFLSGRAKDMLIYKGYNVYPLHLEELLAAHPAVAAAAVIGAPGGDVGEIPVAYVVLRPGAQATPEELAEHVAARVAPYSRLREVILTEALPVSAAGKILKTDLRAQHAATHGGSA